MDSRETNSIAEIRGGFLVGREPVVEFMGKLVSENTIDKASKLYLTSEIHEYNEEHEPRQTGVYHSISFETLLRPEYVWPEEYVFLISPPTAESLGDLLRGSAAVLGRIASKSASSKIHRTLLVSGVREVFGRHPVRTVRQGVRSINRDAIGEVHEVYDQLDPELRPEVHIITPSREQMFEYDEEFVRRVESYGFTHHPIIAGHNAPHTSSDKVAGVIRGVLKD